MQVTAFYCKNGDGYMVMADASVLKMEPDGVTAGREGLSERWWAETGMIGIGELNAKYLNRFQLRVWLPEGSTMTVKVRYDDGDWITAKTVHGGRNASLLVPVVLRRCDHAALRLEGEGVFKLFNMNKVMQVGGAVK